MGQGIPMELTKIKKIAAEIQEFPAKIDSKELAKNARHLLKKYAILSEKIERNVLIGAAHQKDLAKIRTEEFKAIRRKLKEKANLILNENIKTVQSKKLEKKTVKAPTSKKTSKADDVSVAKKTNSKKTTPKETTPKETTPKETTPKETTPKKTVKKSSPKPKKATVPKEGA